MKVTGVHDVNEELIHIFPIYSKPASNSRPIPLGTHSIHPYQWWNADAADPIWHCRKLCKIPASLV